MKFIFARPVYFQGIWVRFVYEGHRAKVKVTGTKKSRITIPQCKTSIAHNSGCINDRAMKFSVIMWFSDMTDRMVWPPSLSRDRK